MRKRWMGAVGLAVLLAGVWLGSRIGRDSAQPPDSAAPSPWPGITIQGTLPEEAAGPQPLPSPTPVPEPVTYRTTLGAIGDILLHNTVYQDAATADGGYDFHPMLEPSAELLRKPGILLANQESLMGGAGLGLSSYPMFNSPFEIGDALKDAGVDLVTMANNHTMDRGEKGIRSAAGRLDAIGMPRAGAYTDEEDRGRIRTLVSDGIRFAFLAYAESTNGIPVPEGKPYLVAKPDMERMPEEIRKAREQADFVVVSMHWGVENEKLPAAGQREWARRLAEWGADIIVGTHPHVIQPMEWLPKPNGGRALVMYSLGNFLSAQDRLPQLIGGMATVEAVKTVRGDAPPSLRLEAPAFQPTYNRYRNWSCYRVIPFSRLEQEDWERVADEWESIRKRMLEWMPELSVPQ
ncbi:CapA family protein [Gorillibacterium sp. sgz5001074]|uniref:CapA family protein n=1 Tax=Gorillibacterium sp. sgz5001074 TaxID=3446695 RepID=UPI003F663D7E